MLRLPHSLRPPKAARRPPASTQANCGALEWAAGAGCLPQLLGVQLLRLRWAVDRLADKLAAAQPSSGGSGSGGAGEHGTGELLALLQARQQLRGPARAAVLVTL